LFIGNGAVKAVNELRGEPFPYHHRNQMLRQAPPGRFEDVSVSMGPAFQLSESTRGTSFGDVDNDGDVDIVVFNGNGRLRLLRNDLENENHWVRFRVRQSGSNPDAVGATVSLRLPDGALLDGRIATDGSYCSANDIRVHFVLGACDAIDTVVVTWPDGDVERFRGIKTDRETLLVRGKGLSSAP